MLACHLGSSSKSAATSIDAPAGVAMTLSSAGTAYTLVDLIWATFWERFPTLKVSLTEGDIGWIPYFLWRAEHVNDRHRGWIAHDFSKTGSPTQIFKDHILVCFIKETVGLKMPDGSTHDGYWYASDVGGAIKGKRIDLYTGAGARSMNPEKALNLASLTAIKVGEFKGCPPK